MPREKTADGGKAQARRAMNLDQWVGQYKIRAFPWIGAEHIYFNAQYFAPGQSIEKPPAWDKTVYITNDEAGQRMVLNFTDTLASYVADLQITDGTKVVITVEATPWMGC